MPKRQRHNRSLLGRFIQRRRTVIIGWALLGALVGMISTLSVQSGDIATEWSNVAAADGADYWNTLLWFGIDTLLPLAVLIVLAGVLFGLIAGAAGFIVALLPRRIGTLADGVALAAMVLTLLQMVGLSQTVRDLPGGWVVDLATIWFTMILLSGIVWNRIPLGLSYRKSAARRIALALPQARDRLQPLRAPDVALADAAVGGHDSDMPEDWQQVQTERDGSEAFRVDDLPGLLPWRRLRYRLTEPTAGETQIEIDVDLRALSPLAWWDVATRPYTEDFLDHLEARLLGKPDRSTYGMLAEKQRKAAKRGMRRAA